MLQISCGGQRSRAAPSSGWLLLAPFFFRLPNDNSHPNPEDCHFRGSKLAYCRLTMHGCHLTCGKVYHTHYMYIEKLSVSWTAIVFKKTACFFCEFARALLGLKRFDGIFYLRLTKYTEVFSLVLSTGALAPLCYCPRNGTPHCGYHG